MNPHQHCCAVLTLTLFCKKKMTSKRWKGRFKPWLRAVGMQINNEKAQKMVWSYILTRTCRHRFKTYFCTQTDMNTDQRYHEKQEKGRLNPKGACLLLYYKWSGNKRHTCSQRQHVQWQINNREGFDSTQQHPDRNTPQDSEVEKQHVRFAIYFAVGGLSFFNPL